MIPKVNITLVLTLFTALTAVSVSAIEMLDEPPRSTSHDAGNDRFIRGEFVALDADRKLQTNVGDFDLSAVTRIVDRRTDLNEKAQVVVTYQGGLVKQVIIYQ